MEICRRWLEPARSAARIRRPGIATYRCHAGFRNARQREYGVQALSTVDARCHRRTRRACVGGHEKQIHPEHGRRQVDRHHESYRAAGRLGPGAGARQSDPAGRWQLQNLRTKDFHHLRRARLHGKHYSSGAGAYRRRARWCERNFTICGAEISGKRRWLAGCAQRCEMHFHRTQDGDSCQPHLRDVIRRCGRRGRIRRWRAQSWHRIHVRDDERGPPRCRTRRCGDFGACLSARTGMGA